MHRVLVCDRALIEHPLIGSGSRSAVEQLAEIEPLRITVAWSALTGGSAVPLEEIIPQLVQR